jgi:membrane protein implicated in regulation of membrane protease activity
MDKKNWIAAVLIFLPLLFGALASFLAQWIWNPVPLMVFKIDVGMVAFVSGVVISLFFGAAYLSGWMKERSAQKTIEQSIQEAEQGRQRFLRRLVNRIIFLHGGQIDVRSRQEGPRGTVFTVRLPEAKN